METETGPSGRVRRPPASSWSAEHDPSLSEAVFLPVFPCPSPAARLALRLDASRPSQGDLTSCGLSRRAMHPLGTLPPSPPEPSCGAKSSLRSRKIHASHLPFGLCVQWRKDPGFCSGLIASLSARDRPQSQFFPRGEILPTASPTEKELGAHFT